MADLFEPPVYFAVAGDYASCCPVCAAPAGAGCWSPSTGQLDGCVHVGRRPVNITGTS